jgi:ribosomal protein L7Ae-like RNA K-turn-binding protein
MAEDKLLGAIGLCRRAGALRAGFDAVCEAAGQGEAALVLLADDASERTRRKVREACKARCGTVDIPLRQRQLAGLLHKKVGVLAVTDPHLATLCRQALPGAEDPSEAM